LWPKRKGARLDCNTVCNGRSKIPISKLSGPADTSTPGGFVLAADKIDTKWNVCCLDGYGPDRSITYVPSTVYAAIRDVLREWGAKVSRHVAPKTYDSRELRRGFPVDDEVNAAFFDNSLHNEGSNTNNSPREGSL
jgi:hypothetical protein